MKLQEQSVTRKWEGIPTPSIQVAESQNVMTFSSQSQEANFELTNEYPTYDLLSVLNSNYGPRAHR